MNLQLTNFEKFLLIDCIDVRLMKLEELIKTFTNIELIAVYVKERQEIIELRKRILSL